MRRRKQFVTTRLRWPFDQGRPSSITASPWRCGISTGSRRPRIRVGGPSHSTQPPPPSPPRLAYSLESLGRHDEAVEAARLAVRYNPRLADHHSAVAYNLEASRRYVEAADAYRQAL